MSDNEWFLQGIMDDKKTWEVKIDEFPFTLGRDKKCNITLTSAVISRIHTKINRHKGELFIEDCESTNGTLLNGRKINTECRLTEGDVIEVCGFKYKLVASTEEESSGTVITDNTAPVESFSGKYEISPRESEVLSYLLKGLSTKKIAESMFISTGTAKNHVLNLLKKTNTHSRVELINLYNQN